MSSARSKSRLSIFAVGKKKPSPARAASTKRASMRRSVQRAPDAPKLKLGLALGNGSDESFGDRDWARPVPGDGGGTGSGHDER